MKGSRGQLLEVFADARQNFDLTLKALRQSKGEPNEVYLSGVLLAAAKGALDRGGEPVVLLLVAFLAPGEKSQEGDEPACCEVEVPRAILGNPTADLRAGRRVVVRGALTGGGGVRASSVEVGAAVS
jgi:hypothetical protein